MRTPATVSLVRHLVLTHGWNATSYQILNPGIAWWINPGDDAVIGFVRAAGVRVVAGAPVCPPDLLATVVERFRQDATSQGESVCFFGAGERLERLLLPTGAWSVASLGAQPSWNPALWAAILVERASLRKQLHRATNKGVTVVEWATVTVEKESRLRECLGQWLEGRHLPALHFLVEPETLDNLADRRLFVAERESDVVGFLVASPVSARNGWLIEQIIRGHGAVNGVTELLVDACMRALATDGASYVTLGLAPLSRHSTFDSARMPWWLRLTLRLVRAHGRRFYNFEGLDTFKAKFEPEHWEEISAVANASRFPPRALWAIAAAFANGSPLMLVLRAVRRGVVQEVRWLRRRARSQ